MSIHKLLRPMFKPIGTSFHFYSRHALVTTHFILNNETQRYEDFNCKSRNSSKSSFNASDMRMSQFIARTSNGRNSCKFELFGLALSSLIFFYCNIKEVFAESPEEEEVSQDNSHFDDFFTDEKTFQSPEEVEEEQILCSEEVKEERVHSEEEIEEVIPSEKIEETLHSEEEMEENVADSKYESPFAPMAVDELKVSEPIDLNEAATLTHSHLVDQSASLALDYAMRLTVRVAKALIAQADAYSSKLMLELDLLDYHSTLVDRMKSGVVYENMLEEVTEERVRTRVACHDMNTKYKDLKRVLQLSNQSLECLIMVCFTTGGTDEVTATTSREAIGALRSEVESRDRHILRMEGEVRRKEGEVIKKESERRGREKKVENERRGREELEKKNKNGESGEENGESGEENGESGGK